MLVPAPGGVEGSVEEDQDRFLVGGMGRSSSPGAISTATATFATGADFYTLTFWFDVFIVVATIVDIVISATILVVIEPFENGGEDFFRRW